MSSSRQSYLHRSRLGDTVCGHQWDPLWVRAWFAPLNAHMLPLFGRYVDVIDFSAIFRRTLLRMLVPLEDMYYHSLTRIRRPRRITQPPSQDFIHQLFPNRTGMSACIGPAITMDLRDWLRVDTSVHWAVHNRFNAVTSFISIEVVATFYTNAELI